MSIHGGTLGIDVTLNNEQINRILEETKRRIQGFSDATAAGGAKMEAAYQSAAHSIEQGFKTIGNTININETAVANLQKKYNDLGTAAAEALMKGKDNKYRNLTQQQTVIQNEINERKKVVAALHEQDAALVKYTQRLEDEKRKIDNASNAQTTLRTQLRKVTEELAMLEENGRKAGLSLSEIRGSEKFIQLQQEAGRLTNAMGDARTQARILSHDNAGLQGVISAVSGVTGAFTVAQGAIGLFGEKNEDLQKIMLRVQSLMAITMGMQQVANTLNKDSALMIKLNVWWLGVKAKAQVTDTAAAAAGTVANIGLAGAFRLVGVAIKSIPVFGWILAGISGLISLVSIFSSKARDAKKEIEEINKKIAESASKPIVTINQLSLAWTKLGDNLKAKEKFIDDNKDKFNTLGVAVNNVVEAEKLLIKNKEKFIEAMMLRAKAMAATELATKKYEEALEKIENFEKAPNKYIGGGQYVGLGNLRGRYFDENSLVQEFGRNEADPKKLIEKGLIALNENYKENPAYKKWKSNLENLEKEYEVAGLELLKKATKYTAAEQKLLYDIGQSGEKITEGSIKALKEQISKLKVEYEEAADDLTRNNKLQQIQVKEKLLAKMDLLSSKTDDKEDPFGKNLEEKKKAYQEYFKWINSTDENVRNSAPKTFSNLLEGGKTYLDYLKRMREDTSLTKEQIHQINNEIAQETNTSTLGEFERSLQEQLNNARTVIDMLNVIKQQREELAKSTEETDPLKPEKEKIVNKQEEDVVKKQKEQTKQLIAEYSDYLDKKIILETEMDNDIELLNKQRAKSTTETDRKAIDNVIKNRKKKYEEDKGNLLRAGYEATKKLIDLEQDNELLNISKKTFTWEADRRKAMLEEQKKAATKTIAELKKMQKEADIPEIAHEIAEVKLQIEELNDELERIPVEKFHEILSGLQKISSALGELDGEVGTIFQSINNGLSSIGQSFDFVGKQGKTTSDYMGQVSNVISGIVDIINMATSASAKRKQAEKDFYQNQIALAHEYALALNEQLRIQSELSGSGFVTNYAGKLEDGFNAISDATIKYKKALEDLSKGKAKVDLSNAIDWGNVGKGAAAGAAVGIGSAALVGAAIGTVVGPIGTVIGAAAGAIVGGLIGIFGGKKKKNEYAGLTEVFPNLVDEAGNLDKELAHVLINTNQLNDETKQLIQNAIDWSDAVEEANKQVREIVVELAGDLGNSLKNAIIGAWKAGEDASISMFEAAGESLGKFVEDLLYSLIFSKVFEDFENELVDSLGLNGDNDIVDDYDRLMTEMQKLYPLYVDSLEAINERAKHYGMNFKDIGENSLNKNSLSGAIKGITQEQADIISGTANAVRVNQVESIEILRDQLLHLASIDSKIGVSNQYLESIDSKIGSNNYNPLRAEGIT
jgi:hypothetical protein